MSYSGLRGAQPHLRQMRAGPAPRPRPPVRHSPAVEHLESGSQRLEGPGPGRRVRICPAPSPSPRRTARTCPVPGSPTMVMEGPPSPARLADPAGPESVIRARRPAHSGGAGSAKTNDGAPPSDTSRMSRSSANSSSPGLGQAAHPVDSSRIREERTRVHCERGFEHRAGVPIKTSREKERRYRGTRLVARLPQACPLSVPGRHPRHRRILRRSTSAGAPLSGHCHLCTSGSPVAPPRRPRRPVV